MKERIDSFLSAPRFLVAGASSDRSKYGNKILRCYMQDGRRVRPVHPRETEIEGLACHGDLEAANDPAAGISIITPPAISLKIVQEAARLGHEHLWLQPGAESPEVLAAVAAAGIEVIAGGPCLLVVLGFRDG